MRHLIQTEAEASLVFNGGLGGEVYAMRGNYVKLVKTLEEARAVYNVKETVYHLLSPKTIGDLKFAIGTLKNDLVVFKFEYGDVHGMCSYKRKETWKQWVKDKQRGDTCQLSKTAKSSTSTSALCPASSKTLGDTSKPAKLPLGQPSSKKKVYRKKK